MTCSIYKNKRQLESQARREYEKYKPGSVRMDHVEEMERRGVGPQIIGLNEPKFDQWTGGNTIIMCGSGPAVVVCEYPDCGYEADWLCDYPVGEGKTCDLPLRYDHKREIGDRRDLCAIHLAEFEGKAVTAVVNPWPSVRT